MNVTIDASVWLAALSAGEPHHERAASLISALAAREVQLHQPGLFIIEVCATIARRTRNRALALAVGRTTLATRGLVIHELDHRLAAAAADVAATCALRGADAVYVATAQRAASTFVTLDREVLDRARSVVTVRTPAEWLTEMA